MSDKIYGFCDAGCRRRVPSYEDFQQSAAVVAIPLNEGSCELEVGKTYRINNTNDFTKWGFSFVWECARKGAYDTQWKVYSKTLEFDWYEYDREQYIHDDGILISIKEITANKVSGSQVNIHFTFLAGQSRVCSYILEITDSTAEYWGSVGEEISYKVKVVNATSVSQVNTDANIKAEGKSAYEVARDNGFEGTETEWLASLKGEVGNVEIVQETGDNETAVMSQKAVTEALHALKESLLIEENEKWEVI